VRYHVGCEGMASQPRGRSGTVRIEDGDGGMGAQARGTPTEEVAVEALSEARGEEEEAEAPARTCAGAEEEAEAPARQT
jgi:hypothetical protein